MCYYIILITHKHMMMCLCVLGVTTLFLRLNKYIANEAEQEDLNLVLVSLTCTA